jgi:hypothetical protein
MSLISNSQNNAIGKLWIVSYQLSKKLKSIRKRKLRFETNCIMLSRKVFQLQEILTDSSRQGLANSAESDELA